jgi:intracellular multiplication protein IcmK
MNGMGGLKPDGSKELPGMRTCLLLSGCLAILLAIAPLTAARAQSAPGQQPVAAGQAQSPAGGLAAARGPSALPVPLSSTTTTTTTTSAAGAWPKVEAQTQMPSQAGGASPADPFAGPSGTSGGAAPGSTGNTLLPADSQAASANGATAAEGANALPSDAGVNPRAPGLMLSADANAGGADPFAAAPPVMQKSPEEIEAEIRTRAYDAAITGLLPMKPGEIRKLLETYDKTQQAVEVPIYPYPKPEVVVEDISLDPGVAPPEIKVATGHVTTLNFLDVTGAPWPVSDVSWAGNFEIVQPEQGGSVMRITPMSEFAYGNMSIRLVGLTTPITFELKTHRDVVQYRFDARIQGNGPDAKPQVMQGGASLSAGNSIMSSILDGVAPNGAQRMTVTGVDGRTSAYKLEDLMYLRTPLTLLSPGWQSSVSSGDGTNVYELHDAPVVLLSDEGQVVRARLSQKDQTQ